MSRILGTLPRMPYKDKDEGRTAARERYYRRRSKSSTGKLVAARVASGVLRCGHEGCTTILSRYNTEEYCAIHAPAYNLLKKQNY